MKHEWTKIGGEPFCEQTKRCTSSPDAAGCGAEKRATRDRWTDWRAASQQRQAPDRIDYIKYTCLYHAGHDLDRFLHTWRLQLYSEREREKTLVECVRRKEEYGVCVPGVTAGRASTCHSFSHCKAPTEPEQSSPHPIMSLEPCLVISLEPVPTFLRRALNLR